MPKLPIISAQKLIKVLKKKDLFSTGLQEVTIFLFILIKNSELVFLYTRDGT